MLGNFNGRTVAHVREPAVECKGSKDLVKRLNLWQKKNTDYKGTSY